MAVDATTTARFFRRDQCGHENDRHFVQRPVRFELRRYFKAVGLWHDKIDDHEIGLELRAVSNARRGSFTAHAK